MPSELYNKIHVIATGVATGNDAQTVEEHPVIALRAPYAIHSWGHKAYVATRGADLHPMTNTQFVAYIKRHVHVKSSRSEIHSIFVDEHKRTAIVSMSYFLRTHDRDTPIEQDMLWLIETDSTAEHIVRTVEYVDAVAAAELYKSYLSLPKQT